MAALLIWPIKTQNYKGRLSATLRHCLGLSQQRPSHLKRYINRKWHEVFIARREIGSRVIKPELNVDLLYPDYKAGLAAILKVKIKQLANRQIKRAAGIASSHCRQR